MTCKLTVPQVKRLHALGIRAIAVNHESLIATSSASPPRDLWAEVKDGHAQIVLRDHQLVFYMGNDSSPIFPTNFSNIPKSKELGCAVLSMLCEMKRPPN